ncbi:unnamed protein product [Dracunculus medinensis]|uniref:Uncharacterized protein n=1 Tax=Dracunculus medinensis TaxID=318479 RepID=A0A158Q3K2_DRAME|nr:unnamed protein product [Dracunculus medinensis]
MKCAERESNILQQSCAVNSKQSVCGFSTPMEFLNWIRKSPSYSTVELAGKNSNAAWHHRRLLLHPLYTHPRRFYHLAGGHQPIITEKHVLPYLRRPSLPLPGWTLRHYSTLPLIYARPSTVDRYGSTAKIYPMDDWTERINNCLDDIGRTARSMNRWTQIKPENRYNFSLVS